MNSGDQQVVEDNLFATPLKHHLFLSKRMLGNVGLVVLTQPCFIPEMVDQLQISLQKNWIYNTTFLTGVSTWGRFQSLYTVYSFKFSGLLVGKVKKE